MADRIKKMKIKQKDGTYGTQIPLGANAVNVDMASGKNLEQEVSELKVYMDMKIRNALEGRY